MSRADVPGRIGTTMAGSEPYWPPPASPPPGAPNVVFVLVDDVGFADIGCFGAEIDTPNLDRLAADGVRFSNFHVNPMCSPTRASLLTGLNCHAAGMGHIAQDDPGYPGYRAHIADDVATAAEILRDQGYATMMVGKWHLTPDTSMSAAGPQHSWPLQRGFDRFYGILEAFTNFHQPHRLVEDNHVVDVDEYPEGYFLTDDLTEHAVRMIRERTASRPGQPFFLYLAHPAAHAPLHAKPDDIAKYRGCYDDGWDEIRRRRLARQIELGVVPADTVLPPRNAEAYHEVQAWDDLTDDEQTIFARYMEVYAAMIDEIDQSMGTIRAALEEMDEWENTIVVFLSDNGASREGELTGTTNYYAHLGDGADRLTLDLQRLDEIGSATTMCHYPRGWAMAGNTPYRLYKRNTHAGGHQVPCIIHWPAGLRDAAGGVRRQYAHCIDVLPTVLDFIGIDPPKSRRGTPLAAMHGTSLAGVLRDEDHPEVRSEQYYELAGHRGFYRDGWEVVTLRKPRRRFDDDVWELYDLRTDPTETNDLARLHPDRVAELVAGWHQAALENQVYPLDEGSGWRWVVRPPSDEVFERAVTIWPGTPTLERIRSLHLVRQRDVDIVIALQLDTGDEGVLVAHGDQGGGYAIEVRDGEIVYVHNDGHGTTLRHSFGPLAPGDHEVTVSKVAPGGRRWKVTCAVDDSQRDGEADVSTLGPISPFTGISVGIDRGSPVDHDRSRRHGASSFTGIVQWVRYEPGSLGPEAPGNYVEMLRELGARYE
jgi:arylsulfatase A-like enzyme